uniref:Uncharacterized protein n=1 Tax=Romanomermis culicivorax TaxID=13658 RepID=A0A915IXL3_ROMCU
EQAEQTVYGQLVGFKGTPYQHGGGLGSFFGALSRMAVPVIKSAAGHVGKQGLAAGAHIAGDLAQGRPIRKSLEEHGQWALSSLAHKASDALEQQAGKANSEG